MPRRLGLERALGPAALAAVAYGEVGSSLYFALGIVALYALGLTPSVLLLAGALFLLVALSYAEGAAAIPETGGAATFVRRAFNDPLGFVTGLPSAPAMLAVRTISPRWRKLGHVNFTGTFTRW